MTTPDKTAAGAEADSLEGRSKAIVASAIELAEQGGFEAVRVRDIAAHAGVALGTLYKRFSSKEDILIAALEQEVGLLEQYIATHPPSGDGPLDRIESFFRMVTMGLTTRTKLARAILRATATGDPLLSDKTGRFHRRMTKLMEQALIGGGSMADGRSDDRPDEMAALSDSDVERLAFLMSQLWWAGLVGWMGGLFTLEEVMTQGSQGGQLLLQGAQASASKRSETQP